MCEVWGGSHMQDTIPDLVVAVGPSQAAAFEQFLKLGRGRVGDQRAHTLEAYLPPDGLTGRPVTFTLNRPLRAAHGSR